jgi:hypothetical protein
MLVLQRVKFLLMEMLPLSQPLSFLPLHLLRVNGVAMSSADLRLH